MSVYKRVLDLYCGAGGASMGYRQAWGRDVEIVGVDIEPQPRYPFQFIQADALAFIQAGNGEGFDFYHASPPCKRWGAASVLWNREYPDLLRPTRQWLKTTSKPYVIENVPGAPLENPLMLCGTMFGLRVIRHRLFEIGPAPIWFPPASCCHDGKATSANKANRPEGTRNPGFMDGFKFITVTGHSYLASEGRQAMGIDWMSRDELSQAIPPAYTRWIGQRLKEID